MNQGNLIGRIRAVGGCVRVGELPKISEKGVEQKRREGKQRFQNGGKLGQGMGALKRGGLEPPYKSWTACGKNQEFIDRNQSMGNHV